MNFNDLISVATVSKFNIRVELYYRSEEFGNKIPSVTLKLPFLVNFLQLQRLLTSNKTSSWSCTAFRLDLKGTYYLAF